MQKRHIAWLYEELPRLVENNVISSDTANRLREHFGPLKTAKGRTVALTVFGIMGAVLIGAGIILVLAHNWAQLSREVRAALSFAPLVSAQVITGWVLAKQRREAYWQEGAGAFLMLMIGSSIALISQTYHTYTDVSGFLLVWMLLSLPLVYLLRAYVAALFYLAGITAWAGYIQSEHGHALLFWPLLAGVAPFVWYETRRAEGGRNAVVLLWGLVLCLTVAMGIVLEKVVPGLWILVYAGLFAVLYLTGSEWFRRQGKIAVPLRTGGTVGIVALSFLFTYEWVWDEIGLTHCRYGADFHRLAAIPDYVLTVGLIGAAVALWVRAVARGGAWRALFGSFPMVAVVGFALASHGETLAVATLYNVYVFILGVGTIVRGLRSLLIGVVNGGIGIVAVLMILRFFDSEMELMARGLIFVLVGVAFLAANVFIVRRTRRNGP